MVVEYRRSAVAKTTIQLCGRLVLELDGLRVESALPGRQGRLLFAFFALNRGRTLGRGELVEAVWPNDPPRDPSEALAALLSKVRATVGAGYLEGRSELVLTLPPDADVDVERALSSVHRAESACSQDDWPRAWEASLAAQLVAKRTLLPDCEAWWIDEWRRTLEGVLLRSLECYANACLGIGGTELAGAERTARQLVSSAPLRESGYGLLMRTLQAQGNVAEALLVYEAARVRLREELGVAPAEPLQAIHRQLLAAGS